MVKALRKCGSITSPPSQNESLILDYSPKTLAIVLGTHREQITVLPEDNPYRPTVAAPGTTVTKQDDHIHPC